MLKDLYFCYLVLSYQSYLRHQIWLSPDREGRKQRLPRGRICRCLERCRDWRIKMLKKYGHFLLLHNYKLKPTACVSGGHQGYSCFWKRLARPPKQGYEGITLWYSSSDAWCRSAHSATSSHLEMVQSRQYVTALGTVSDFGLQSSLASPWLEEGPLIDYGKRYRPRAPTSSLWACFLIT
jgi:hypothetical protein